ncbi:acyl-CoA desaturase, partial [Kocuria sp. M4R2S49]
MASTASSDRTTATARQAPDRSAGPAPDTIVPAQTSAAAHLTTEQVEELARELDAIRAAVIEDRGAEDAAYIRRVIRAQRSLEVAGRATLLFAKHKPAWIAGTGMLTVAKILENMEIG